MTRMTRRRKLARAIGYGLGITALVFWAAILRPTSLGGPATYLLVRGTSMLPTYKDGDLLILLPQASYAVGDPVAYRVPDGDIGAGKLVIHRIVGGDAAAGFELQGDNNDALDPWHPRQSDVAGSVRVAIPSIGRILGFLRDPVTLGALASAGVTAWLLLSTGAPRVRRREGWST